MRRLAALCLAVVLLACGHRTAGSSGLARVRAAGVLRWGGDLQGGEPFVYEDPVHPGRLAGFEAELATALARELGVRAEFHQNDWSNLIPSLERGSFDVILNGLEVTPARAGRIRFTRPYYVFAERLMARRGETRFTADLERLRGRRVGTLTSSLAAELLRGRAEVVNYDGVEEPYIDLARGRTDAVLLDDIIAMRYGQAYPDLMVLGDVADGYYAVGVNESEHDLRAALDGALARLAARGELRGILERAGIWNDRQRRLEAWDDARQRAMLGQVTHDVRMSWHHVWLFVQGAGMTLALSLLAMALAVPFGIALALVRLYGPRGGGALAASYVELYRGTPVLLQLYVLYYGLAGVLPLGAFTAAVLGLGMNYAAYEAEVYRAGMQAVPRGQMEAALALGMSTPLALRRVLLPQAFRLALPGVTNDFIALLKDSSLVSVITVVELTKQMTITAVDTRGWALPGLVCAALYFAMGFPLSRWSRRLEARLARS